MLVPYSPSDSYEHYREYYANQTSNGISVYKGKTVMGGNGIESVFAGLMRDVVPVVKRVATKTLLPALKKNLVPLVKRIGSALLKTGFDALGNVITGQNTPERRAEYRQNLSAIKKRRDSLRDEPEG